jgi:DNA modification methylase
MDDNSVDLIITDPPYDFSLSEKLEIHLEMQRISKGSVIVFSPPENQWILPADQYLFWTKPISTKNTSKKYSRFVEMIFVYREGIWNEGRHWSQYVNVFNDFVDSKDHPFRKPPSLIKRLLLNHSHAGSVVFDPFMGSGVVPSVCLAEGRDFIGCEKDMDTFELTKERLVYLTKKRLPELHIGK